MDSPVEKIKERLSIEEVVSSYIKLDRAGANLKAKCPFHNEKTPSFFVSPSRESYYCFGCGAKGDIFTFIEEFEGLDFKGALKILAERAGVDIVYFKKENNGAGERLYEVLEESTKFFEKNLRDEEKALEYLKNRGLEDKTIKNFRIGYVGNEWRLLYSHLKSMGYSDQELENAGLVKKADPKKYYDVFRGRIMFPISDSSGRVIAFTGRILQDDGKSAKYLNSPETSVFSKSSILFGLDKAKDSIRKNNFSILVEGQMDLVLSHQAGFRNTIATSGTALSESTISNKGEKEASVSNLGLVRRLSSNIVLAFDGDEAGFKAMMRAGKIALSLDMDVKVATLPLGLDPAELILKNGKEAWQKAIRDSKHIIEFLLKKIISDDEDLRKAGKEIKEKVLPYVGLLESSIERDNFIKKISDLSGIREEALREDLLKAERESKIEKETYSESQKEEALLFRKDFIERRIMGIIFWQKNAINKAIDPDKAFEDVRRVLERDERTLLNKFENSREDLIYEAEIFYGNGPNVEKDLYELLLNLEEECLKEKISKKMHDLKSLEVMKDPDRSKEILREISEINKRMQDIKNKN